MPDIVDKGAPLRSTRREIAWATVAWARCLHFPSVQRIIHATNEQGLRPTRRQPDSEFRAGTSSERLPSQLGSSLARLMTRLPCATAHAMLLAGRNLGHLRVVVVLLFHSSTKKQEGRVAGKR